MLTATEMEGVLTFLRSAEMLKNTIRSAWTSAGRNESVAEHTWRLTLMAMVLHSAFPQVDFAKLVKMCIIHDLGEAIHGDIPAIDQDQNAPKSTSERYDLLQLIQPLPEKLGSEIVDLWDEYEAAQTPKARLAKALDKLETILQHNQGQNPSDFDYRFNLAYGVQYTKGNPVIESLRAILDRETMEHVSKQESS